MTDNILTFFKVLEDVHCVFAAKTAIMSMRYYIMKSNEYVVGCINVVRLKITCRSEKKLEAELSMLGQLGVTSTPQPKIFFYYFFLSYIFSHLFNSPTLISMRRMSRRRPLICVGKLKRREQMQVREK